MLAKIDKASIPKDEQSGFIELEYAKPRIYTFYLSIQIASAMFCPNVDINPPYPLPIPQREWRVFPTLAFFEHVVPR